MASRCSVVCACQPASAATTRQTIGAGPSPANMLPTKRSWPGTSTNDTERFEGRNNWAKPKSMVNPRSRSAAQRSVVAPVRARTSADLPWSTCPAVAMTNCSVTLQPPRQWLVDVLGPDHHWLRARTADPLSSVPRRRAAKLPADRYVAAKRNPLVIRWPNRKVAHRLHRRHRHVPDEK